MARSRCCPSNRNWRWMPSRTRSGPPPARGDAGGATLVRLDAVAATGSSWTLRMGLARTGRAATAKEIARPQRGQRRPSSAIVASTIALSASASSLLADQASRRRRWRRRRPWRGPRRSRRARRRRSCPRPCGRGARPERRRRFSAWLTMPSASARARSIMVAASASACGRLGLIFGPQRLGLGAQLRGLVELLADAGDLLVERLADRAGTLFQIRISEDHDHRQRDPAGGVEAQGGRLGVTAAMVLGGRRQFVMTGGRTFMRDGLGRGGMRLSHWPSPPSLPWPPRPR